jgi:pimeloyl-ACP methyl ester carboxylesterase
MTQEERLMTDHSHRRHAARSAALITAAFLTTAATLAACGQSTTSAPPAAATHTTTAAARVPPTQRHMITNQGHKLAFYVTPGHLPAIVLDAGGGNDASYWTKLVPTLAASTGSEIIAYDRAGSGASDEVPGPWLPENAASDLNAGLTQLGVTHDVILVAHSLAGEVATYFVRAHPGLVTGAVLIDCDLPEFYTNDEITRVLTAETPQLAALKTQPSTRANRLLLAIGAGFVPAQTAFHLLTWPTTVPATVIASAQTPFPTSPIDAQRWRAAQAAFAAAAPNRTLITAAGTSHDVPHDRPDIVSHAIDSMIATTR